MATLRILDQRSVAPGQAPGEFSAPDASRGAQFAARQQQAGGQATERLGQVGASIFTAEMQRVNETRVADALTRAQQVAIDQQTEYSQLKGGAALKVGEEELPLGQVYSTRFNEALPSIARDMGLTATQQEMFERQVQPLAMRFQEGATRYEMAQSEVYNEQVYTSGVSTLTEAFRTTDPGDREAISDLTNQMILLTAAEAKRRGLPPAAAELAIKTNVGAANLAVVTDLADENVDAAQAYFDARYEDMTAAQRDEARKILRPAQEMKIAEQVAAIYGPRVGPTVANPGGEPSFEQTMLSVYASEGDGFVANDNGAGRARYGITERSYPQAWADGDVTREEADRIYRGIWDRVVTDNMNAGMAHMVFDTAVNMGEGKLQSWIQQSGGDVTKFAELRRAEYRRIAAEDPDGSSRQYLAGWLERVDKVEQEAMGQAPAGEQNKPAMTESQAVAAARAALPEGAPPSLIRETERQVRQSYREFDQAEAAGYEAAEEEAYAWIEANKTMPGASILSRLKPGTRETVENYHRAVTTPPPIQSDFATQLSLAARPDLLAKMSPEEIVAEYGTKLSESDLLSAVGVSARATQQQRAAAADARVVPHEAFSRALNQSLDLRGVDRTPESQADRQDMAELQQSLRGWIVDQQVAKGAQLTDSEISTEIERRLNRLAWEQPGSIFQRPTRGFASTYTTMSPAMREKHRTELERRGVRNPTPDQIFSDFLISTISE